MHAYARAHTHNDTHTHTHTNDCLHLRPLFIEIQRKWDHCIETQSKCDHLYLKNSNNQDWMPFNRTRPQENSVLAMCSICLCVCKISTQRLFIDFKGGLVRCFIVLYIYIICVYQSAHFFLLLSLTCMPGESYLTDSGLLCFVHVMPFEC